MQLIEYINAKKHQITLQKSLFNSLAKISTRLLLNHQHLHFIECFLGLQLILKSTPSADGVIFMPFNVFVTRHLTQDAEEKLNAFCNAEYWPETTPPSHEVLLEKTRSVDGLVCLLTDPVDREVIRQAQNLKVISQVAVGVDNIDLVFIDRIKVWKLASNRNNGLLAMLDHIKKEAQRLSVHDQAAEKEISES
jgi:hypothetical protein